MVRVLFVCAGNICRSPISQAVFENVLRRVGLESEVFVDSAGTGRWCVGSPPDEMAQSSARMRGLDLSRQRARQISRRDCHDFDYIITMDDYNYSLVSRLCSGGTAIIRPFLDYSADSAGTEIPDPYGGGPEGFERVLDLAEEASEGLLEDIRERYLSRRV